MTIFNFSKALSNQGKKKLKIIIKQSFIKITLKKISFKITLKSVKIYTTIHKAVTISS